MRRTEPQERSSNGLVHTDRHKAMVSAVGLKPLERDCARSDMTIARPTSARLGRRVRDTAPDTGDSCLTNEGPDGLLEAEVE
jgi:hypothetical protein